MENQAELVPDSQRRQDDPAGGTALHVQARRFDCRRGPGQSRDLSKAAKVDFAKPHAPLLLTSGSTDNITPAHLNLRNFKKYKKSDSVLDYKEFPGRNHFVVNLTTWKEDADYILDWVAKHSTGERVQATVNSEYPSLRRAAGR